MATSQLGCGGFPAFGEESPWSFCFWEVGTPQNGPDFFLVCLLPFLPTKNEQGFFDRPIRLDPPTQKRWFLFGPPSQVWLNVPWMDKFQHHLGTMIPLSNPNKQWFELSSNVSKWCIVSCVHPQWGGTRQMLKCWFSCLFFCVESSEQERRAQMGL